MVQFTFHLPLYRLRLALIQKRRGKRDFLLELLDELKRVRIGSRFSRIARRTISIKRLQRLVGINLVALVATTNLISTRVIAFSQTQSEVEVTTSPAVQTPLATIVVRRLPVDGALRITQGYGFFHAGVDIDGVTGDPIYPIMNGRVERTGKEFFLGNMVVIDHGNSYKSVYAHLNKIHVKPGQEVNTSTRLGDMGNTGRSTGDHLHLEVYKDGKRVNPMTVLPFSR